MLRKYCLSQGKEWDDGIPHLLFAIRTTVQESLGFSPSELVFRHAVHGPLKILQEEWLATDQSPSPAKSVLDYVTSFHERLHNVCDLAKSSLTSSQSDMKSRYDQKSVQHAFIFWGQGSGVTTYPWFSTAG